MRSQARPHPRRIIEIRICIFDRNWVNFRWGLSTPETNNCLWPIRISTSPFAAPTADKTISLFQRPPIPAWSGREGPSRPNHAARTQQGEGEDARQGHPFRGARTAPCTAQARGHYATHWSGYQGEAAGSSGSVFHARLLSRIIHSVS